jgi:hypothetical protein
MVRCFVRKSFEKISWNREGDARGILESWNETKFWAKRLALRAGNGGAWLELEIFDGVDVRYMPVRGVEVDAEAG